MNYDIDMGHFYLTPNIYNVLNEARGISNECYAESIKITDALHGVINKSNTFKDMVSGGTKIGVVREGNSVWKVFDHVITLKWTFYNFFKKEDYNQYYSSIIKINHFDVTNSILQLTLFGVSGNLDSKRCEEAVAHELFHCYKYFKPHNAKEKEYALLGNKISSRTYNRPESSLISNIMYLISKEEIQAFCNGAFAKISEDIGTIHVKTVESLIENTILFNNYKTLDKFVHDFQALINKQVYGECCKEIERACGVRMPTYEAFVKYMENGKKEYLYQIGRLSSLLKDKYNLTESQIIFEHYF